MKQFRDWMHGKGQGAVMVIAALAAMGMVLHYAVIERGIIAGSQSQPALSESIESKERVGSFIGPAKKEAGQAKKTEDAAPKGTEKPETPIRLGFAGEVPPFLVLAAALLFIVPKGTEKPETPIRLGFAGDICLDDTCAVMRHMKKRGGISKVISPELIEKMNSYDSMIINNEFSISGRGKPMEGKAYTFRSSPSNVKYLKKLGVDVAGLANNHIYDYGKKAFLDTLDYLKKAGIKTMGAGKSIKEARKPLYLKIKGKTIALVAASREIHIDAGGRKKQPGGFQDI